MDFYPGGALPVPHSDVVIPILNRYVAIFEQAKAPIYVTRDWHPPTHISFQPQGGPWPPHCVQETEGAKFHPDLRLPRNAKIISKATTPNDETYSGFQGTVLEEELRKYSVRTVFVGGLATDYCVKDTVLDALKAGFDAVLLIDAVRGVDVHPGDSEGAIREMVIQGASVTALANIILSE